MRRKIYTAVISLAVAAMALPSCSKWLDLYPVDEIKEEYLFETGDGYRTALNGIYRKMATFDLYGSNLTWGLVDAWGQAYYLGKAPDSGGGKAMKKISGLDFRNMELVPTTNAMWNAAWNVVANCNNLAQHAAAADSTLFYGREAERQMIYGEAVGIRAFVQFDMLRIYAPAPSFNGYAEDARTFIPYVNVYPSYINDHRTVTYCLEQIIKDLKEAQAIMEKVDEDAEMSSKRFSILPVGQSQFLGSRGFRLNYCAITAELARVYLYAGKNAEAYAEAKKLIDINDENSYFTFTSRYSAESKGNKKLWNDVIFGLYSPTELVEWDQEINHGSDGKSDYEQYYLCLDSDVADELYGDEKDSDYRFRYQLESKYYGYYYRPLKYYKQEPADDGEVNNLLIPMIRMSEIYYIAAESIYDSAPEEAKEYIARIKSGRGISSSIYNETLDGIASKSDFINLIVNDARREFLGEGQIFYMYKRLMMTMPSSDPYDDPVRITEDTAVLPLPDSETSI